MHLVTIRGHGMPSVAHPHLKALALLLPLVLAQSWATVSVAAGVSRHEIPEAPIAPVDTEQCQDYNRRMTELISRVNDSAYECIKREPSLPQAALGACCREWVGEATGVCRVPARCAVVTEQRYCLWNERRANFDACIEQVASRGRPDGASQSGPHHVSTISREIDALRSKVDALRQVASPGLRHALARRVVDEALHHTLALTGDALLQFDTAMIAFDNGLRLPLPGTPEAQAVWLRQHIATNCSWLESSGELVRCVNEQLLLNRIEVVRSE